MDIRSIRGPYAAVYLDKLHISGGGVRAGKRMGAAAAAAGTRLSVQRPYRGDAGYAGVPTARALGEGCAEFGGSVQDAAGPRTHVCGAEGGPLF